MSIDLNKIAETYKKLSYLKSQYEGHLSLHAAAALAGDGVREAEERQLIHAILDNILDVSCESAPVTKL